MGTKSEQHMLVTGKAGTGKTHFSIEQALSDKRPIVIIRSVVPTREVGFLPGELEDKLAPYFELYTPIFRKLSKKPLKDMVRGGQVHFVSTSFLRGVNMDNCTVILDEAQNCTLEELETVLTRLGKGSRLIVIGDVAQTDLKKSESGFQHFCHIYGRTQGVEYKELFENRRSRLLTDYFRSKKKFEDK